MTELADLVRVLLATTEQTQADDVIEAAVTSAAALPDAQDAFVAACASVGLGASPLSHPVELAARLARPDLPIVVRGADAFVIDRARLGFVRVTRLGPTAGTRWLRPSRLAEEAGAAARAWRIEPLLPATPLGPHSTRSAKLSPSRRLLALLAAERSDIAVIVVYAIAIGLLALATPLAIQVLINWLAFGALLQPIVVLGLALLVCLALAATLRSLQRVGVEIVQRRIFVRAVTDVVNRLARVRVESFDRTHGPELVNRFFDVLTLQKAIGTLLLDGVAALLQAGVGLLLLALYHPTLLAFDAVAIALTLAVLLPWLRRAERTAIVESKRKYAVAGWIEELAAHPVVFKLGDARLGEARANALARAYLEARESHFRAFLLQFVGMQTVQVALGVGLLVVCGWLVLEGELTLGQLVAAEFVVASALAGVAKFTDKLDQVYDLLAGVDKLGALLDLPHDVTTGRVALPSGGALRLATEQLGYRYPDGEEVLSGLDLAVDAGGRLAVLVSSGGGKSTLAELVAGVRPPSAGVVLHDDVPADAIRPDVRLRDVSLIRAGTLLHASVRDNVALARPGIDDADVWSALREAGIDRAVRDLPDGLDTVLGPTGAPLSPGRSRAVLVARALAGRPRLIVVDAAVDGLDPSWRDALLRPLLDPAADHTLVVLTSDARVARRLPRTLELTPGGLVERPRVDLV